MHPCPKEGVSIGIVLLAVGLLLLSAPFIADDKFVANELYMTLAVIVGAVVTSVGTVVLVWSIQTLRSSRETETD